ncbi:Chitin synthase 4 [Knufia obscura]|uniref:Chitin synthase 4 n=1 Tax=Knufia obscura TaxID=1635080 RepID=A0ABR0RJL2_9EURO|nr:Chitin synthase 4 [Knufia obscura]
MQIKDLPLSPGLPPTSSLGGGSGSNSRVQIHPPDTAAYFEDYSNDNDRLSPILSHFPRRQYRNDSGMSGPSSRAASPNSHANMPSPARSTFMDESQPEIHEPLQYHHLNHDEQLAKRASRLTVGTMGTAGSNGSGADMSQQQIRNSYLGADLQRPDSGFSSQSEQRGRTLSPHLSPQRPSSRHSRSPDSRPLSYVDLLNVPYPQQAPSGTENLINAGLRNVVGDNASLLSTRKTLDMYRMNVKKTNDPAIQYEFAIFMISAAQEEGLEEDRSSLSGASQKSAAQPGGPGAPPIKSDLFKEAKHILQKLCDKSYPFAQYYLADGYASGLFNNGKPDLDRSFTLFVAASKHGHAEAMYRTALCYEYGWGCRVDAAKAVQFYQHAASKNHPGAMLRLGRACLTGEMGLVKRYREGIRWLKRGSESADLQYNQAPFDLACLHEEGYGPDVFKDESYAAQLYTKAADLGHKDAAFRLGEAYEYGQLSCPKDASLSIHFYTGAAEQGHPQAQMALCAWYMVGVEGVLEKDEGEAYEWARKAAEQGLPKAQYTVGYFTEMGIGCRRDPLEANVWYVRAADQGEERAKHRISAIRAASAGMDPMTAAQAKKGKQPATNGATSTNGDTAGTPKGEGEKKKKFGLF